MAKGNVSESKEVKHIFAENTIEELNRLTAMYLEQGYTLIDAKVLASDWANGWFRIFYIFAK
jgi:hypothetical protein